jgi:hypothetical protein
MLGLLVRCEASVLDHEPIGGSFHGCAGREVRERLLDERVESGAGRGRLVCRVENGDDPPATNAAPTMPDTKNAMRLLTVSSTTYRGSRS